MVEDGASAGEGLSLRSYGSETAIRPSGKFHDQPNALRCRSLKRRNTEFVGKQLFAESGIFAMLWDDLWGEDMQRAFIDAGRVLCKRFDVSEDHLALIRLPVSYGPERPIGLFTSFKI